VVVVVVVVIVGGNDGTGEYTNTDWYAYTVFTVSLRTTQYTLR